MFTHVVLRYTYYIYMQLINQIRNNKWISVCEIVIMILSIEHQAPNTKTPSHHAQYTQETLNNMQYVE